MPKMEELEHQQVTTLNNGEDKRTVSVASSSVSIEMVKTEDENKKKLTLKSDLKETLDDLDLDYKFCVLVGPDGISIMILLLLISGLFAFLTYQYSNFFTDFSKEFLWVFIFLGCLYLLPPFYHLIFWKRLSKKFSAEVQKPVDNNEQRTSVKRTIKGIYNDFQIYGRRFLYLLYFQQMLESLIQIHNLLTIYLCSLPVGVTSVISLILSIDSFHTMQFMVRENSISSRDKQVIIDTIMDLFCFSFPISYMYFGFNVPITKSEMISITVYPALSMLSKFDSILDEIMRSRAAKMIKNAQNLRASRRHRHRQSVYGDVALFKLAKLQQESLPHSAHIFFGVCKGLFGLFFLIIGIYHFFLQNGMLCEQKIWNGCLLKVPYCKSIFQPTCNCAVLHVKKHNWTKLPSEIETMNALKIMQIQHGRLETIPSDFHTKYENIRKLDFSNNHLTNLPGGIGTMKTHLLGLDKNQLSNLPDSVWGNKYLIDLILNNNNISIVSPHIQNAKSLLNLYVSNNTLRKLPRELFHVRTLMTLLLDGNNISVLPKNVRKLQNLQDFALNNNYLVSLPKEIGDLVNLEALDLRNNLLQYLPEEARYLKSLQYIYLHSNPLCTTGWLDRTSTEMKVLIDESPGAGCTAQCSIYCQDVYLNSGTCENECNSLSCKLDGGDCLD